MYTPKAFFEERGESAKLLDVASATAVQARALDVLRLGRGWILIVDSGTAGKLLGRVGMTTAKHEGSIGNNNLIRVIVDDPVRQAYVFQFLRSDLGQALLLRNVYGTNQDHIEPDDVKNIPIPVPRDQMQLAKISTAVAEAMRLREEAIDLDLRAQEELDALLGTVITVPD
jgi:type I restriction enzyme M protein